MTRDITVEMLSFAGTFAENKDMARKLRLGTIRRALNQDARVILDFTGIESTTQSFIHALISELIREFGINVLDSIVFKGCNDSVKSLVSIVTEYMQHEEEPTQP
jgi:hypothetical protein